MKEIITKVETVLSKMGLNPEEARAEKEGQWNIAKSEDIQIMLDVWEENGILFFQVMSYVCDVVDENSASFFRLLLEENHGFCETAFTVLEGKVFLKYTTEADDIDEERIYRSITRVAFYNEMFQGKLG